MAKVKIKVVDNGPFFINGEVEYIDGKGNKLLTTASGSLCRCGKSKRQPFCTGECQQNGFKSAVRK